MSAWGRSCAIGLLAVGLLCQSALAQTPNNPFRLRNLEPDIPEPEPAQVDPFEDDPVEAEPIEPEIAEPERRTSESTRPLADQLQPQPDPTPRRNRTPAAFASQQNNQPVPQSFEGRLARAPKMLGDFFGRSGTYTTTQVYFGDAVHHLLGTATGMNELRLIEDSDGVYIYGSTSFLPTMSPPLSTPVEGLTLDGGMLEDQHRSFIAFNTFEDVNVYVDPNDFTPDLIEADVFEVYEITEIMLPNPSAGDIIGRVRLQDNNSPIPQDRCFFDYNYFHNVPFTPGGVDVNRFAPGLERTFWDRLASFEIRVPMGLTLSSNLTSDLPAQVNHSELGNIALATKFLLLSSQEFAFTAGCGVSLPTADDLDVGLADGTDLISVQNDSVHLLPYLAFLYMPEYSNCFFQSFLTFDLDTNGTPVYANINDTGLQHIGRWNDQNLLTLSLSGGAWIYENNYRNSPLSRVALTGELHYTETLNDADSVGRDGFVVGDPTNNLSLVNATFGTHITSYDTTFTFGYTTPLTSSDRVFDGEFRFMLNRPY